MNKFARTNQISGLSPDEAAAHWHMRHDRGDMNTAEIDQFKAWLAEAPRHVREFEAVQKGWSAFDKFAEDDRFRLMRQAALEVKPQRMMPVWAQVAASVAILCVGITAAWLTLGNQPGAPVEVAALDRLGAPDYVTEKGERLNVSLPDGSALTLNTETVIDVAYEKGRRIVKLVSGQAYFEVAKDASRPFIVYAGNRRITALGTAFNVRVDNGAFEVLLVEGQISVDEEAQSAVSSDVASEPVIMAAGEELVITEGVAVRRNEVDTIRELRWRDGFIEFKDETLEDALIEFNRYATKPFIIRDERVAALRVTGLFRTDRVDHMIDSVSALYPVDVRRRPGGEILIVWTGQ